MKNEFLTILFCVGICTLPGCAGEGETTDAGTDADGSSHADIDETVRREILEDVEGFCTTSGAPDDTCKSAEDCVGYRIPVPIECRSEHPLKEPDCAFANREEFPSEPECTADEICRHVARACVEGRCVVDLPDDSCTQDKDCVLHDDGCACTPKSISASDYSPEYGMSCPKMSACPPQEDAHAKCIRGRCYIAGPFMDEGIEHYCHIVADVTDHTFEDCRAEMIADDYEMAALNWKLVEASLMGETMGDLIKGPWSTILGCLSVLCP